jgi:hypothetical protein
VRLSTVLVTTGVVIMILIDPLQSVKWIGVAYVTAAIALMVLSEGEM